MAALYDLREELTALLRQGLPDAAVTGEYPGEGRRYPQTVPAVAVGIAEAALQKLDYLGEQDAGEQSGRRWETRFQLELSAPRRSGAGELYRLFDQVSGLLLTYGSRYGLQEVDCGKAEYIRERDCFALTCTALCVLEETETQPGTAIAVPKAVAISGSSRRAGSVPCGAAHTRASSTSCRRPRVATRAQEPTSPRMSRA